MRGKSLQLLLYYENKNLRPFSIGNIEKNPQVGVEFCFDGLFCVKSIEEFFLQIQTIAF